MGIVYKSASEEKIAEYRDKKYPAWINDCENIFSSLHATLQRKVEPPSFRFVAANEGTRPGKDALVDIKAKGNFLICPPQIEDKKISDEEEAELCLPLPPKPPRGEWGPRLGLLNRLSQAASAYSRPLVRPQLITRNERRDPNAFYYKHRPIDTRRIIQPGVRCQWRHEIDEIQYFEGEIFASSDQDEIQGALECEIHAENLSTPIKETIKVRIVVVRESTKDYASNLIRKLSNSDR